MIILTTNDFAGFQGLAKSINLTPVIQAYINHFEKKYIMQIFGVELGKLLIADLSAGVPATQRFKDVVNPFDQQVPLGTWCGCEGNIYSSLGLKDVLASFVYYHYTIKTQLGSTQGGMADSMVDTAKMATARGTARNAEKTFNDALDSVDAIQWFCKFNSPDVYPEYAGVYIAPQYQAML